MNSLDDKGLPIAKDMTTTDEALVTDEEIAWALEDSRFWIAQNRAASREVSVKDRALVELADRLADRLAALDAERAEMVALLEATAEYQSLAYCDGAEGDEPISYECYDEPPCWSHRAAALLAKLKGGTP